jgi:hypothetical protein
MLCIELLWEEVPLTHLCPISAGRCGENQELASALAE